MKLARRWAACVAAGLLLATGYAPAAQSASSLTKIVVALPFVNVLPAGIWVAKDRGFFRTYGVDLEIISFRGSTQAIQALLAGQDVVGIATIGAKLPGR